MEFGTWIGECISFASDTSQGGWRLGHYDYCASEYYPASPTDFSTWALTDAWYASNLAALPTNPPHFILDTSRNGQPRATDAASDGIYATEAPGQMTLYAQAPYAQSAATVATLKGGDWCNPPGSGVGLRPTADTGNDLVDAYLWVKTVGESDGACAVQGGARAWGLLGVHTAGLAYDGDRSGDVRSALGARRSGSGGLVPAAGTAARVSREPSALRS